MSSSDNSFFSLLNNIIQKLFIKITFFLSILGSSLTIFLSILGSSLKKKNWIIEIIIRIKFYFFSSLGGFGKVSFFGKSPIFFSLFDGLNLRTSNLKNLRNIYNDKWFFW